MEKENPYLNLYLGALKKPWSDYCEALGKKPGAALKEAIEQQLAKAAGITAALASNGRSARRRTQGAV